MAQLVNTTIKTPLEVKDFINGLTNGYTDVLFTGMTAEGYVLIIHKA